VWSEAVDLPHTEITMKIEDEILERIERLLDEKKAAAEYDFPVDVPGRRGWIERLRIGPAAAAYALPLTPSSRRAVR
jgi:hypothetical protein